MIGKPHKQESGKQEEVDLPVVENKEVRELSISCVEIPHGAKFRKHISGDRYNEWEFTDYEGEEMRYFGDGGVVVFVDKEGRVFATSATIDNIQALKNAGYKRGHLIQIPFTEDGQPVDERLVEQWMKKVSINGLASSKWVKVPPRTKFNGLGGRNKRIQGVVGEEDRMTYVSDDESDCIAFADEKGHVFVAPYSSSRYGALIDAGYRPGNFYVPFSKGELPVDDKDLFDGWRELNYQKQREKEAEKARLEKEDLERL